MHLTPLQYHHRYHPNYHRHLFIQYRHVLAIIDKYLAVRHRPRQSPSRTVASRPQMLTSGHQCIESLVRRMERVWSLACQHVEQTPQRSSQLIESLPELPTDRNRHTSHGKSTHHRYVIEILRHRAAVGAVHQQQVIGRTETLSDDPLHGLMRRGRLGLVVLPVEVTQRHQQYLPVELLDALVIAAGQSGEWRSLLLVDDMQLPGACIRRWVVVHQFAAEPARLQGLFEGETIIRFGLK